MGASKGGVCRCGGSCLPEEGTNIVVCLDGCVGRPGDAASGVEIALEGFGGIMLGDEELSRDRRDEGSPRIPVGRSSHPAELPEGLGARTRSIARFSFSGSSVPMRICPSPRIVTSTARNPDTL
jgi:hypothetical protein